MYKLLFMDALLENVDYQGVTADLSSDLALTAH